MMLPPWFKDILCWMNAAILGVCAKPALALKESAPHSGGTT